MKLKIVIICLFVGFFSLTCEQDQLFDQEPPTNVPSEKNAIISEGNLTSIQLYSPSLEGNLMGSSALRTVNIYLPKSYGSCPDRHFPVIYFLHGMPAWENMLITPEPFEIFYEQAMLQAKVDFPDNGFVNWLNNLVEQQGMREAIIVMPDARTLYGSSTFQNSEILGNFENYIVEDLVNYIDSHFRTIPHFNWRAITGQCAGGYGALNIAMHHPHVFRYVGALSPAIFTEQHVQQIAIYSAYEDMMWEQQGIPEGPIPYDPESPFKFATNTIYMLAQFWLPNPDNPPYFCDLPYTFENGTPIINPDLMTKFNAQNLFTQTQQNEKGLRQLKTIYFDCGINDDLMMYPPNEALHDQLQEMHIKHQFETYNGTHISNLYDRLANVWVKLSNEFPDYD